MPLVFVHGVNIREGSEYELDLQLRNRLFLDVFFRLLEREMPEAHMLSPCWGNLAPSVSADSPFLPRLSHSRQELPAPLAGLEILSQNSSETIDSWRQSFDSSLNGMAEKALTSLESADLPDKKPGNRSALAENPLLAIALQGSVEEMLDIMMALAFEDMKRLSDASKDLKKITDFAFQSTRWRQKFSTKKDQLEWLKHVTSDEELIQLLKSEIKDFKDAARLIDPLSIHSWLKEKVQTSQQKIEAPFKIAQDLARKAIKATTDRARKVATEVTAVTVSTPARKIFHHQLSAFIGDSFFYFGSRGKRFEPGPVPEIICDALKEAESMKSNDDPELIVVAHSMGGIVTMDVLSHFEPNLEVDLVLSVGTQFPLFADLDMFPGLFGQQRPFRKPENVHNWINIFDPNDFLGYSAEGLFQDIIDVPFSSGRFGVSTHCDYFKFVSFFELMAASVKKHHRPKIAYRR